MCGRVFFFAMWTASDLAAHRRVGVTPWKATKKLMDGAKLFLFCCCQAAELFAFRGHAISKTRLFTCSLLHPEHPGVASTDSLKEHSDSLQIATYTDSARRAQAGSFHQLKTAFEESVKSVPPLALSQCRPVVKFRPGVVKRQYGSVHLQYHQLPGVRRRHIVSIGLMHKVNLVRRVSTRGKGCESKQFRKSKSNNVSLSSS